MYPRTLFLAILTLTFTSSIYTAPHVGIITADQRTVFVSPSILEKCPPSLFSIPVKPGEQSALARANMRNFIATIKSIPSIPTTIIVQSSKRTPFLESRETLLPFLVSPERCSGIIKTNVPDQVVKHLLVLFSEVAPVLCGSAARDTLIIQNAAFEQRSPAITPDNLTELAYELGCSPWVCEALQAELTEVLPVPESPLHTAAGGASGGDYSDEEPEAPAPTPAPSALPAVTRDNIVVRDGVLDLSGRNVDLTKVTKSLVDSKETTGIQTLNLRNTTITGSLDEEGATFPNLHTLILSGSTGLHIGADTLKGLGHLRVLDLSHCAGVELDANCFTHTPNLEAIRLDHTGLTELPDLSHCPHLHVLEASHNNIKKDVPNLSANLELMVVDLSHNKIKTPQRTLIPGEPRTTPLRYLLLNNNCITALPIAFMNALPPHGFIDLRENPGTVNTPEIHAHFKRNGYTLHQDQAHKEGPHSQQVRKWIFDDMRTKVRSYSDTAVQRMAYPAVVEELLRLRIDASLLHESSARALYCWAYRWRWYLIIGAGVGAVVGIAVGGAIIKQAGATLAKKAIEEAGKKAAEKAVLSGLTQASIYVGAAVIGGAVGGAVGAGAAKYRGTFIRPTLDWHPDNKEGTSDGETVLSTYTTERRVGGRIVKRTEYSTTGRCRAEYIAFAQLTALLSIFKQNLVAYLAYLRWLEKYDSLVTDRAAFLEAVTTFENSLALKEKKSLEKIDTAGFAAMLHDLIAAHPFHELGGTTNKQIPRNIFSCLKGENPSLALFPHDEVVAITKLLPGIQPLQIHSLCKVIELFNAACITLRTGLHNKFFGVHQPVEIFKIEASKEPLLDALLLAQKDVLAPFCLTANKVGTTLTMAAKKTKDAGKKAVLRKRATAAYEWKQQCQCLIHLCSRVIDQSSHLKAAGGWL